MARKSQSRAARWADAAAHARDAYDRLREAEAAKEDLSIALQELEDLRSEYEEWKDNLPEFAQSSAMADKLEAITGISIDPDEEDLDSIESMLDEIDGADLPLGFGRD